MTSREIYLVLSTIFVSNVINLKIAIVPISRRIKNDLCNAGKFLQTCKLLSTQISLSFPTEKKLSKFVILSSRFSFSWCLLIFQFGTRLVNKLTARWNLHKKKEKRERKKEVLGFKPLLQFPIPRKRRFQRENKADRDRRQRETALKRSFEFHGSFAHSRTKRNSIYGNVTGGRVSGSCWQKWIFPLSWSRARTPTLLGIVFLQGRRHSRHPTASNRLIRNHLRSLNRHRNFSFLAIAEDDYYCDTRRSF